MISIKVSINTDNLDKIISQFSGRVSEIVAKAGFDCEAEAKAIVPVDTGMLKGSITTELEGAHKAVVSANTEYAGYVEDGTYKMAAQPYMRPAADIVEPQFVGALEGLVNSL